MRKRTSGVSLPELLVAMAVGALLISSVLAIFLSTSRATAWVSTRADMDATALMSLTSLSREVRESAYPTLTITATPHTAIAFRMQDAVTQDITTFTPAAAFTLYYLDSLGHLVRKTWWGTSPTLTPSPLVTGVRLRPPDVESIIDTSNGSERVLATGLTALSVVPPTYPTTSVVSGITVNIALARTVNSSLTVDEHLTTTVCPRNHP